jgi:hypothetical protein
MAAVRRCRVSVTDMDGVTHAVEVQGTSAYDVAATALAQFRHEGWVDTLGPATVLRVEVHLSQIVHNIPLTALQRWANGPSVSPKQELLKRPLRRSKTGRD